MTYHFSAPAEKLFADTLNDNDNTKKLPSILDIETLIIGSGYGAAMSALALTENNNNTPEHIVVVERGDEYLPEDFPRSIADIPPFIGYRRLRTQDDEDINIGEEEQKNRLRELWDVRIGDGVVTITGSGLGGTSLVNASVVLRPDEHVLEQWPRLENKAPWAQRFNRNYKKIEQLLGVTETPNAESFAKFQALKNTVEQMDEKASITPAPVSINFDKPGPHSVDHEPCNLCGNCVTGCHSGAKQSLNLNAWPLAVQLGVKLFTGVTVHSIERNPQYTESINGNSNVSKMPKQWLIHVRKTRDNSETTTLFANKVILAAGTLGSSSILNRCTSLALSPKLGHHFSVNGDTVKFSVGQAEPVNAVADAPEFDATNPPGPTIIGVGKVSLNTSSTNDKLIVEDGAIPYSIAAMWSEMITTQSMISQYAGRKDSAWHKANPDHDRLAVSKSLTDHSQVLLTMGHDKGTGRLVPNKPTPSDRTVNEENRDDIELVPSWDSSTDDYHKRVDRLFNDAPAETFKGGQYQPNPAWQLIPPNVASTIAGAADIPSSVVSVHPLGGCIMGSNRNNGVVNCQGQVFNCDGADNTAVYENLYVLDGSIIPTPVGTNPLMTIASIAYELASEINTKPSNALSDFPVLQKEFRKLPKRSRKPALSTEQVNTHALFRERLFWDLRKETQPLDVLIPRLQTMFGKKAIPEKTKVLVLDISFTFDKNDNGDNTSLENWLQNPNQALSAQAQLRASSHAFLHTSEDMVLPEAPVATFKGFVNLGVNSDTGQLASTMAAHSSTPIKNNSKLTRSINAIYRYAQFRWMDVIEEIRSRGTKNAQDKQTLTDSIKGYFRFAGMHSRWHHLVYRFERTDTVKTDALNHAQPTAQNNTAKLTLMGQKTLAYRKGGDTLWDALTILPVMLANDSDRIEAKFSIDLVRIVSGPAPLQITQAQNTPQAITSVAQLGAYFFRTLVQTHFWSLGALPYNRFPTQEEVDDERLAPPAELIALNSKARPRYAIKVQQFEYKNKLARLIHYTAETKPSKTGAATDTGNTEVRPALMFTHGLAHGTRLFWTSDTKESYLQYFIKQGFDIWLLDHRGSANYRRTVDNTHTVEDLADDVRWAVKTIYTIVNKDKREHSEPDLVHVLAHCVGAAATSIAALKGDLQQPDNQNRSMLASFSLHAVTPWLFGSAENRARQNLWWFIDQSGLVKELDSTVHSNTHWTHILFDRIAHSMMNDKDRRHWGFLDKIIDRNGLGYTRGLYSRYRFFYGPEFNFENVSLKLRNRFQLNAGKTPIKSVKQMFLSVVGKRLVNADMESVYLTEENLTNFWQFPTMFYHGNDNKVFDIESSRMSAYALAHFRKTKTLDVTKSHETLHSDNYTDFGVRLKTLKNYGHMDMIFGEQATKDIGPHLLTFLQAAELQHKAQTRNNEQSYTAFSAAFPISSGGKNAEDQPFTSTIAERLPTAGPVLSHVRKNSIRVWVESDDYDTYQLNDINISAADGAVKKDLIRAPENTAGDTNGKGRFWIYDLVEPASIKGPVSFSIEYGLDHMSAFQTAATPTLTSDFDSVSLTSTDPVNPVNPVDPVEPAKPAHEPIESAASADALNSSGTPTTPTTTNTTNTPATTDTPAIPATPDKPDTFAEKTKVPDSVTNQHQAHSGYTQENQPSYLPYVTDFTAMPWFKREFRQIDSPPKSSLSIALGSCLHPGTSFERERSDAIFSGIWQHTIGKIELARQQNDASHSGSAAPVRSLDLMLLLGDQIYADASAEFFDPVDYYERYRKRYRAAWTGTWMRRVMSHLPTHFVVDDHEIHDNFSGKQQNAGKYSLEHARREAYNFQLHVPPNAIANNDDAPLPLWHSFNRLGTPFFCFDTRFNRSGTSDSGLGSLFGVQLQQWHDFLLWLNENKDADLLVLASGSPLCPVSKNIVSYPELAAHTDGVLAYPEFLAQLTDNVIKISPNVKILWLSGDPHFSSCANIRITCPHSAINITSITASGLYAPFPFANANPYEYNWDSRQTLKLHGEHKVSLDFMQKQLSDSYRQFTRLDIELGCDQIQVASYGADGQALGVARELTLKRATTAITST